MRRTAGAMASAPGLTEAQLREFALPETFARGREYCESGAVSHLRRRGAEHLALPFGERTDPLAQRRSGQAGVDHVFTTCCPPDRHRELFRRRVLQEESVHPGRHRMPQIPRLAKGGQDQGPALRQRLAQGCRGGDAIASGHLDVDQRHVRTARSRGGQQLIGSSGFPDDYQVIFHRQERAQRAPHRRLVFSDQDPDHATTSAAGCTEAEGRLSRMVARKRKPASGSGDASRVPPIEARRSSRPRRPFPAGGCTTRQPSLSTSTWSWPSVSPKLIWQCLAPACRITFVVASRITHPSTASDSRSSAPMPWLTSTSSPAAVRAT